jgi:hypothetical protein
MLRIATAIAAVLLAGPSFAQTALQPNELVDWSGEDGPRQAFSAGDITMTLSLAGDEAERTAILAVASPGKPAIEVTGVGAGTGYGQIGVAEIDMSGARSVLFAVYAGGAHCCMEITAITETPSGWVADAVGSLDGDNVRVEDLDGDGVYEIPLYDDRFNYAFDAFAFSFPPPLVMKVRDGRVYDASNDPAFAAYFEAALVDGKTRCSGDTYELAACAGVLAIAARLGSYEEEAPSILKAVAEGKTTSGWQEFEFCSNADCTATEKFASFAEAVGYALRTWGYLR